MESTHDANQPRQKAWLRKGFSTSDLLQSMNEIIEKCNGYTLNLNITYADYESVFDSVEHESIF